MASTSELTQSSIEVGLLPDQAAVGAESRDLGVYIHVPFCDVRCGYCDFVTFTDADNPGVTRGHFPRLLEKDIAFQREVLAASGVPPRPVQTVFFGGGTPTVLASHDIGYMLHAVTQAWGLAEDAEITIEANPDSVDPAYLTRLRDIGITRVSLGMQSAIPHVLETLDRTHTTRHVMEAVAVAKDLGLQVSLDLLYGTPGESADDWTKTLETALVVEPDHISAYSLVLEEETTLHRRVTDGELSAIDDDTQADFYLMAEQALTEAGLEWYEVNNWARSPATYSRHNLAYWRGQDWVGLGPSAHSHMGGVRWWNAKHPRAWADRVEAGEPAEDSREVLDQSTRELERIMHSLRLREGLTRPSLAGRARLLEQWRERGLVDQAAWETGVVVLSPTGRLLADGLARELVESE